LVVFTAGLPSYANPLIDKIDPKRLISARLFRQHMPVHLHTQVKDLARLGRPLNKLLIVDNLP
jgi:RNA polymerase II subunit A small phosphatase-like protein